jgi:cytochrome c biogenesis protein CcdA/glutathione peroxidase-family protein
MHSLAIDSLLGFVEGLGLIVSPCILPILPIFLSSSLDGSRKRPLGIIFGFVLTFAVFTFFSRKLVQYSGIDLNVVRHFSFFVLALLGCVMISSYLSDKFSLLTRKLSNIGSSSKVFNNANGGFGSGVLFGTLIAFIWTPCAGPILAAVIVQTVLQKTSVDTFFVLLSFGLGAGIPMLLIAIFGRFLMAKLTFFKVHSEIIRKLLGVIILASVAWMVSQDSFAGSTSAVASSGSPSSKTSLSLLNGVTPYPAPPLVDPTGWINTAPFTLHDLLGRVVLVDFWTYSCINCVRTLPYTTAWYDKYHKMGFEIVGVHTPEFDFEKDISNVKAAVAKYGIKYPVVLDSSFGTWQSFSHKYWPAQYLIDKKGDVVYTHFGEGDDDVMENNIRYLLGLPDMSSASVDIGDVGLSMQTTPETYLGMNRADRYSSPEKISADVVADYSYPTALGANAWALSGKWNVDGDFITSSAAGAGIKIRFQAKNVYVVMGNSTDHPLSVKVLLDGEAVVNNKGSDVQGSLVTVPVQGLYNVLGFKGSQTGVLQIIAMEPGLQVYTFTFG